VSGNENISAPRWIEIDINALHHNALAVKSLLKPDCLLMAVIKDNAYGAGGEEISAQLEDIADMFAVTTVEEGVALRKRGLRKPILIFAPPGEYNAAFYGRYELSATIDRTEQAAFLAAANRENINCHIKVNTGMNRLGVSGNNVLAAAQAVREKDNLILQGLYSHFYNASASEASSRRQLQLFLNYARALSGAGINIPLLHIANSAAIINMPESHLNMVRCGTLLYGQSPVKTPPSLQLKEVFQAYCRVLSVQYIEKGDAVGYGGDYRAPGRRVTAVLPIGYSDGFGIIPYVNSGAARTVKSALMEIARVFFKRPKFYAYFEGRRLPVCGRVSMQLSTVDATETAKIKPGDIVSIPLWRTCANPNLARLYYKDGEQICPAPAAEYGESTP
jgi:alanine racemase